MAAPQLQIHAVGGRNLKKKDLIGKQDPYLLLSLTLDERGFQKSATHRGGAQNPTWNQVFTFPLPNAPGVELYAEVYDEDPTTDEVIGFAAIPLDQIRSSPFGAINAYFDIFTPDGKPAGEIQLLLTVSGQWPQQIIKGQSGINPNHQRRIKSKVTRNTAAEVGMVVGGGLLAAGAGLLTAKLVTDQQKREAAEKAKREAEEKAKKEAEERRIREEQERQRFQAEREAFEQQKVQFEQQQKYQQEQYQQQQRSYESSQTTVRQQSSEVLYSSSAQATHSSSAQSTHSSSSQGSQHCERYSAPSHKKEKHRHGRCDRSDSSDSDEDRCKRGGRKWDPVGTYNAGDRVEFQGRTYVCLQYHTSNPTWQPTVAPSLWRAA